MSLEQNILHKYSMNLDEAHKSSFGAYLLAQVSSTTSFNPEIHITVRAKAYIQYSYVYPFSFSLAAVRPTLWCHH